METTERIVEAYVRYVRGWATIANIRCTGQNEIDLLAIDPVSLDRYHIEVSISISQGFRKLTGKPFDREKAKVRVHQASQRRTLGFFVERKFEPPSVIARLADYGFDPGNYHRVIVTWGWDEAAAAQADGAGIQLWDFPTMMREVAASIRGSQEYFADDTLRTLNLFIHASDDAAKQPSASMGQTASASVTKPGYADAERFWVYENWPNNYACVHRSSCSQCNDGEGTHSATSKENGQWLGPFANVSDASRQAQRTGRESIRGCGTCSPLESN